MDDVISATGGRNQPGRRITAMTALLILAMVAALAVAGTIRAVRHDDRGTLPPPASHRIDPDSVPPAQRLRRTS